MILENKTDPTYVKQYQNELKVNNDKFSKDVSNNKNIKRYHIKI
ncbi:hypothetical protein [Clostridium algoriphilum]|nr:hypothetical protein [Clostridium algoriphilum]